MLSRLMTRMLFAAITLAGISMMFNRPVMADTSSPDASLHLLPWPLNIEPGNGQLLLNKDTRIVTDAPELRAAADVLAAELLDVTGQRFTVASGSAHAGDISLALDPKLAKDTYALAVTDRITVTADQYRGVTWAIATILQLVDPSANAVAVPRVTITDHPHFPFPGLMVDVARNRISLDTLRQVVLLCHFYKVPYLQLHLSDDQGFAFPSKSFPQAGSKNHAMRGKPVEVYPIDQLRALVHFADQHGVTIIPEIETPGHSGALQRSVPDIFGYVNPANGKPQSLSVINLTNDAIYPALDKLVGDLCDVFQSSPFIHIGCDEVYFGELAQRPELKAYLKAHGLTNVRQLYPRFINRMDEIVKKHGKQTIVWEAFHANEHVNKDITVLAWDGWNYPATDLVRDGYRTIHVPWTPSIGSKSRELYDWDPYLCHGNQLPHNAPLFGAMMVYWEQTDAQTVPMLRMKLPIRQERIWNTDAGKTFEDMARRLTATDQRLDRVLYGFDIHASGLRHPRQTWVDAGVDKNGVNNGFATTLSLNVKPTVAGTVRYTLDGSEPAADSPVYNQPLSFSDTTDVHARLFDNAGKPLGATWFSTFEYQPFVVDIAGTVTADDKRFGKSMTLSVPSIPKGGTIHYEQPDKGNKNVTIKSPVYSGPIVLDKSQSVALRYFDAAGKPRGYTWKDKFDQVDFDPTNLTYHKPVTSSSTRPDAHPQLVTDGVVQVKDFADTYWGASPAPQWVQVDLQKEIKLGSVQVFPYYDGHRYYQYTVELSQDGQHWTQVADLSHNTQPATPAGTLHEFTPQQARYIRVNMLKNSANPAVHVVEIRAFAAK